MPSVSFSIVPPGVKAGAEIKSGDTVVLKVIKSLSGGNWQVSHKGRLFVVKATIKLEPGQIIRTKASTSGSHIILRQTQNNPVHTAAGIGTYSNLPIRERAHIEALVQAFQKAGLQTDTPIFRKARALFSKFAPKNRSMTSAAASVLAALAEKNLNPDFDIADYIAFILDRGTGSSGDTPRRQKRRLDSQKTDIAPLVDQLKLQFETPGKGDNPLQLFNHLKGKGETWILLPYNVSRGGNAVTGTIRLRMSRAGIIKRVVFDAFTGRKPYTVSFDWPFAGGDPVTVGCEEKDMLRDFIRRRNELPEKLRNLDSINDDNSIEGSYYDGIALERINAVEGVDRFA